MNIRIGFHSYLLVNLILILNAVPGMGQEDAFRERLTELRNHWEKTSAAVEQARGYPRQAGRIDLKVAGFFNDYIEWELEHPEMMKEALIYDKRFRNEPDAGPDAAERRYWNHIDRELSGSMALLNRALNRIGEERTWPDHPDIPWDQMDFEEGYFRVEGEPVFPGGFNMVERSLVDLAKYPEWEERDREMLDAFLEEMRQIGVGIIQQTVRIPELIAADGSIRLDRLKENIAGMNDVGRKGFRVNILSSMDSGDNKEALENLWPGITRYTANGVGIDIDHPGARELIRRVTEEVLPLLAEVDAIVSWDMANEPFFSTDRWSPHTLYRYRKWLQDEHGTIRRLNTVWKTDYSGFDAIPLPKEKPRSECSPGEWYDRIRFHNHRVTSFFGFFSDQIRSYLPEVKIHLKAQDNSSLGPMRQAVGHGIDREALTRHIDLQGLDTRPLPVTEPRMAASSYDGSHYGFHWLGQSFLYDYLTSLPPGRPIVDFEYHAFSINPIRIPDLPRNHASATLWLAHMHGMVGNMAWYWHRRYGPDPFLDTWYWKLWLYASLSTQPVPAAEYFQTMLELNTFSREVEALATVPDGPVCIMVSKPSYIQDPSHIDALHRVYEGSSFHGLRVGFVTDQMLVRGGVPSDCRVMFVPNMAYLGKAALNVLEGVKEKLILYGGKKPRFDPYGFPHAPETVRFLENVAGIEEASAPVLSRRIGRLLTSYTGTLPIRIKRLDRSDGFGVMNRQAGVDDRQVMLLVNVLTNPTEVQMISKRGEPISGYDLLNDEPVDGKKISMPFQGVRLIQIDQE